MAVLHDMGEGFFLLPVTVGHGLVRGGPEVVPGGALVSSLLAGGFGFRLGVYLFLFRVADAEAD